MKRVISKNLAILLSALIPAGVFAVSLEQKGEDYVVKNDFYTANLAKKGGYRINFAFMNGKKVLNGNTNVTILMDMQNEKYNGGFIPTDAPVQRGVVSITPKVLSNTPEKVVLEFSYKFNHGSAVETYTFNNTMAVNCDLKISKTNRIASVKAYTRICTTVNDGLFYPDKKYYSGFQNTHGGIIRKGEGWAYGYYKKNNTGTGFILPRNQYESGLHYQMQDSKGWGWNSCNMSLIFDPLRSTGKTGTLHMNWYLLAGGNPDEAQKVADSILGKKTGVELYHHEIQKISVKPGSSNTVHAELRNHSAGNEEVTLRSTLFYGLDNEKKIFEKKYTLAAGQTEKIEIPVKYPAGLLKGTAVRSELLDKSGKVIGKHTVFCAVTDFVPRDAPVGVMNMQMAHQPTSELAWVNEFKQRYVASYEYYAWAYTTIFGLAPEENEWFNNSDSFYDIKVTKDYIKSLVKTGKDNGVDTYAWITGLWHYKVAYRTPELMQYTADGQPNIYHGRVMSNGKRRQMVVKPNAFDVDFARKWGEEMVRSIDMFGWAGCRWDWTFVPSAVNDPLKNAGKVVAWYNHEGIPSTKLFPDPDQTAYDCTVAWRKAVNEKYPDFIFGVNASGNKENWPRFPKHQKEISRRAMTLFEDMLSFYRPQIATFEKWGRELAERAELYRPQDAAPTVGWMRGLPSTSVSTNLAQYTSFSAGVKWVYWPHRTLNENSEIRAAYVLRYADYYFGTDFLRPAELSVNQAGKDNILWEPFVRERKTKDGREIVVPIVNMPDGEKYICQYHDIPPVRQATFKIALKPGETATAWVMTPQSPEKAKKLEMKGNTVTVPGIVDAAMLLIQCKGGK